MPFKIVCDGCGLVLYEGRNAKTPYEVVGNFEGRCPKCCRKLSPTPLSFEVGTVDLQVQEKMQK